MSYLVYRPELKTWEPASQPEPVQFEGFEHFTFFVARSTYGWAVYESSTGMMMDGAESDEKQSAVHRAKESLTFLGPSAVRIVIDAAYARLGAAKC